MSNEITPTDDFVQKLKDKLGDFLWESVPSGTLCSDVSVFIENEWLDWSHEVARKLAVAFVTEMAEDIQKYKEALLDDYNDDCSASAICGPIDTHFYF